MWPIQEVTYIGLLYMIWSPVRNLGMATLEQSDLVFRRFIRPLGPFGLVKHEVKPRLLSYVISHAEPDTTLPTSIHMVERILVGCYYCSSFFSPFCLFEQLFPLYKSLVYAAFV